MNRRERRMVVRALVLVTSRAGPRNRLIRSGNELAALLLLVLLTPAGAAVEFHVSMNGDDSNEGSSTKPFKTISAGARVAQPGDVITTRI